VNVQGLYGALLHQLGRRGGLHVLRVYSRPLGVAPSGAGPGLELRVLGAAELVAHARDPTLELREAMIRDAAGRGDLCFGALDGGVLVGYVWFSYARASHVDGIWVQVPPRAVYRYKSFVRPAFRGRGIAAALYGAADAAVARPGRDIVVDCVHLQNFASMAATLKTGSRPLGALAYWQAGRWFIALHSAAVRRLGLRFYRAAF
jgi:GNAT superfamily N-acetyltransferase